jgi:hypothetical protein
MSAQDARGPMMLPADSKTPGPFGPGALQSKIF